MEYVLLYKRARDIALMLPPIKRLVAQRDELLRENDVLQKHSNGSKPNRLTTVPSQVGSLCTLVNPAHWLDPDWLATHHDLSRYTLDRHCSQNFTGHINRKGWEWTHCVYGLRQLGMLQPESRAVGVGVGQECVIYYLADHVGHVVATDLYGEEAWSTSGGKEADLELLEASKRCCPDSVDFSKITFENQNGTRLSYADDSFDFAWSLSSIEHFGGHDASRKAVEEMVRVVKSGGIVALATECLLLDEYTHTEYFNRNEIDEYLIHPIRGATLVDTFQFHTLTYEYLVDSVIFPHQAGRIRRHVILNHGGVQSTSFFLFYRVG